MDTSKTQKIVAGSDAKEFWYGLFSTDMKDGESPMARYYTRYAASRKCEELNTAKTDSRWFIRTMGGKC